MNTKKKLTKQVNEVNEMTKASYARYRGVSKAMVTKWLNDGRLVLTLDGNRVMVNESDKRINETANLNNYANDLHAAAARAEVDKIAKEKTFTELKLEVNATQLDLETDNADVLFKNARALREKSAALQAAAEHENYIGLMVKREVIERVTFDILRALRDNLVNIGRRISVEVAVNSSAIECEKLISNEIDSALASITKEMRERL